jgi:hypothetical protein
MSMEKMSAEEEALFANVYVPAFAEKCAQLGVNVSDEDTLQDALETTAYVKQSLQQSTSGNIKAAKAQLKQALGVDLREAKEAQDGRIRAAAQRLCADVKTRQALLSAQA